MRFEPAGKRPGTGPPDQAAPLAVAGVAVASRRSQQVASGSDRMKQSWFLLEVGP